MVRAPALAAGPAPAAAGYLGTAAVASPIDLEVVLAPSNQATLDQLASDVSTPTSPDYHHFLTEPQFVAEFAPPASVVQEVQSWLSSEGFSVSQPSPFVVQARGDVAQATKALGVSSAATRRPSPRDGLPSCGHPYRACGPGGGRDNRLGRLGHPGPPPGLLREACETMRRPCEPSAAGTLRTDGSHAFGLCRCVDAAASAAGPAGASYTADQLASHYKVTQLEGDGQNGAGVTIALPEINASSSTDIGTYENCFGLSNQVSVVPVDGGPVEPFSGPNYLEPCSTLPQQQQAQCFSDSVSLGEADIDIQMATTMAPGASIEAYETGPFNQRSFGRS